MKRIQALRMSLWEQTALPSGVLCRSKINRPFPEAAKVVFSIHRRLLDYKHKRGSISRWQWIEQGMLMGARSYTRLRASAPSATV